MAKHSTRNRLTRFVPLLPVSLMVFLMLASLLPAHAQDINDADILPAASDASSAVVINEILYNPDHNTEWIEFIELYNPTETPISLANWRISGGVDYLFPADALIASKGYLLVGEAPSHLKAKYGVTALGPYDGGLSSEGEDLLLTNNRAEVVDEIEYGLGFPWPIPDGNPDQTIQLVNANADNAIGANWRSGVATPGAANNVLVGNTPPLFLDVSHEPESPKRHEAVTVSAEVIDSDGVQSVTLFYQVVKPGEYISIYDAIFQTQWTSLSMAPVGDDVYEVEIPGSINENRTLVRYRIEARDTGGRRITVPYADDPQPNFAYFVYNGLPYWKASYNGAPQGQVEFHLNEMREMPLYQFIGKQTDIADALFLPNSEFPTGYMGSDEAWRGTLVVDGEVFDHVQFRARGGEFRYATGKTNWRINLHVGHRLVSYDNWGNPYPERVDKVNLYGISQQVHRDRRGEQGMFDSMTYRLYNEAGVPGPYTNYIQLHVVDNQYEYGGNQYWGDFWGLYLSVEHPDGRFLDNHDMPDGNLYKIEEYQGDLDNLSKMGPDDNSDINAFLWQILYGAPDASWWRENFDLEDYYSFRAILEFTHDYDVNQGKNYYFFRNDDTGKWEILPWDKDLTWYVNMPGTGIEPIVNHVLTNPEFNLQYQNRIRELRDLLLNDEQIFYMLDEYANVIDNPPGGQTIAMADRFMWDFNPIYGTRYVDPYRTAPGHYYLSTEERTFRSMVEQMKQYALDRFAWMDYHLLTDRDFPVTPSLNYSGAAGFAADQLRFDASPFADPQGAATFGKMEWRIAEISKPTAVPTDPTVQNHYEIDAVFESGEVAQNGGALVPPQGVVQPGHLYRARVRYQDNSGRWSHWSAPVEFRAGEPKGALASVQLSEIMYNPLPFANLLGQELEFVELYNSGATTVDLSGWTLSDGIEYTFEEGATLAPGAFGLVVENEEGFAVRYDHGFLGKYDGALSNGGERITLKDAWGRQVFSVEYSDDNPWPEQADGEGYSLVYLGSGNPDDAASWRRSTGINGSPGEMEPSEIVINEVVIAPASARAVELYNPGSTVADISHWFISDEVGDPRMVQLPAGSRIQPGGYLVVDSATLAGSSYDGPLDFTPRPRMEMILSAGTEAGNVTGYQTRVQYAAPEANLSAGLYVDSQGSAQFPLLSTPTLGAANAAPHVGPLVVSEILYKEAPGGMQYIELTNISNSALQLASGNPLLSWQLLGGYFAFPGAFSLPAGGTVLVTSGSPHVACADFADRGYARIFGPFIGVLNEAGQSIALERPATIGGYLQIDRINYYDTAPWPQVDAGVALLRTSLQGYGNDPANWQAASAPSPQSPPNLLCALTADAGLAGEAVAAGSAGATITWTLYDVPAAAEITTFRVVRNTQPSGGEWVEVGTLNVAGAAVSATHTLQDSSAQPGTIYYYAIEGYDAGNAQTQLGMTTTAQPWQPILLPIVNK